MSFTCTLDNLEARPNVCTEQLFKFSQIWCLCSTQIDPGRSMFFFVLFCFFKRKNRTSLAATHNLASGRVSAACRHMAAYAETTITHWRVKDRKANLTIFPSEVFLRTNSDPNKNKISVSCWNFFFWTGRKKPSGGRQVWFRLRHLLHEGADPQTLRQTNFWIKRGKTILTSLRSPPKPPRVPPPTPTRDKDESKTNIQNSPASPWRRTKVGKSCLIRQRCLPAARHSPGRRWRPRRRCPARPP